MGKPKRIIKRIIVTGGRHFGEGLNEYAPALQQLVYRALDMLPKLHPYSIIIVQGGARGADRWARVWANSWAGHETFRADWDRFGSKAGPIRNQEMVDAGAHLCIAFPGGNGTADCVRRCRKAGIPVWQPLTGEDMPRWL